MNRPCQDCTATECAQAGRCYFPPALKIEIRDTDHEALLNIQELLDGNSWTVDTLDEIALILTRAGYPIRDLDELPLG
jgi:hypothetical protein